MSSDIVYDDTRDAWCHQPSGACSANSPAGPQLALPTYATVADVLEKKNGSGIRLLGWTAARSLLIAPPMMLVGVPAKRAFAGALIASVGISLLTLLRISNAEYEISRDFLEQRPWLNRVAKLRRRKTPQPQLPPPPPRF